MYLPTVYEFASFFLIAQESGATAQPGTNAPASPASGPASEAVEAAPQGLFGGGMGGLMLPILLVLAFYMLMMIIPGRREQKKTKELLESLKKNDRVLTAAGIKGTIVNIAKDSPWATIRIDEANNTKMQVLRTSISRVLTGDGKEDAESPDGK